jgi:chromate reductase, NAD(P)H dehydrogenase (quinone)
MAHLTVLRCGVIRLLAISGSLRAASSNTALLRAAVKLAPENLEIEIYEDLANLPHFNPDLEVNMPETVLNLKARVGASDGLLISSPEYAHGVPGTLKNALDWLVSGIEFIDKPVAFWNASPSAKYATASLIETVTVMTGQIISNACVTLPLGPRLDEAGILAHAEISETLRAALMAFAQAIAER